MDDEGAAVYGVHPGAIADFGAFKAEVERFFQQTDDETVREWLEARDAVRAGTLSFDGVPRDASRRAPSIESPGVAA